MITTRGTLQARLLWAFALVTVIAVALPAVLSRNTLYHDRLELESRQAMAQVTAIRSMLDAGANDVQITAVLGTIKEMGERLTVADKDGKVIHDSHLEGPALQELDNHNDRPEIEAALATGQGVSIRHSNTLGIDAVYAAQRMANGSTLRLAVPLAGIRRNIEKHLSALTLTLAGVAALCLLLSVYITRRFRGGIDTMAEVVAAIAKNKGGRRLLKVPGREFLPLAYAVNRMAENIEEYVTTTTDQHTQLEVILESMHEGILVLGPTGNIRRYNRAMRTLFPAIAEAEGKQLIEALPVPALQRRVEEILQGKTAARDGEEAVHFERDGRFLVAHISRPVEKNQSLGAVIVIYDATAIMRLERVRRDFVANVSHELRTPLTAISGYAETLMHLEEMDPAHRNFAAIIHKHAQALGRVISDLLALTRIEDAKEKIPLAPVLPEQPLHEAMRLCADLAASRRVRFAVELEDGVSVMGNASLLTQVFRNLFENACRYSPEGGEIVVSGRVTGKEMLFSVKDQGPGIPQEELTRIFERLYQVKKQRNSGSSGIGLAISKHIIERHGGTIWAESPYQGFATAMLFTLPVAGNT
ncbi:Sensory box histidine kinase [uncultured delta proteobacterium]|uniref:histidine kinase n=1 Tax=uncultured delta proteobacterium TaxID=34034 RepID=A0A212K678_9DELT|nr:Sensory box histidine kinase [uncultured delta proteobacterium]